MCEIKDQILADKNQGRACRYASRHPSLCEWKNPETGACVWVDLDEQDRTCPFAQAQIKTKYFAVGRNAGGIFVCPGQKDQPCI